MTEGLEKYRKTTKIDRHLNFLLSQSAVDFFSLHPDITRGEFVRDAVDEKIARVTSKEA